MGQQDVELTKWQKMTKKGQTWTKDDLFDVVSVIKQILAILIGVVWGAIPLTGGNAIVGFFLVITILSFLYYARFLGVDDEEFGRFELIQEGLFSGFAIFLLSWIMVYNLLHVDG